ncbi:hypothetical protein [Natrinema hispanicum]|uniref:Uncharacterized protein n=1 Tax=Natrinema hispanicum TaxID=392421 RepID=A0A1H9YEE7_9EURY|nr:hypothetical protein [Natrinema hispanicum]SDC18434.1 hypothetical protein SAMN05192552_100261 [Natrinema hispanicum]SES66947.1 hypothetical protein SAMN04488694_10161 [Natrinema hispanicum]
MFLKKRTSEILVATAAFLFVLGTLTGLRVWDLEPATSVQSAIVNGAALFITVIVVLRAFQGTDLVGNWILTFGPSFGFTLNLFIPVMANPAAFIYPLVTGAIVSGVITLVGYSIGRGFSVVWNRQDA